MNKPRKLTTRRTSRDDPEPQHETIAGRNVYVINCPPGAGRTRFVTNWDRFLEEKLKIEEELTIEVGRELTEADLALPTDVAPRVHLERQTRVPAICEWLMCLAVDPEFHEDRIADYQERFNETWLPRFGYTAAGFVYVWHVLRQSGLVNWIIRMFIF